MKIVFRPLLSSLIKMLLLAVSALPVVWIIQWLTPNHIQPFTRYIEFITTSMNYLLVWGDWIVIIGLSLYFSLQSATFYRVADEIRLRQLLFDVKRWERTPYIPPLMLYYLLTPPVQRNFANDTFYSSVMHMFRDRVFMDLTAKEMDPEKKLHWLKIVGITMLFPPLIGLCLILWSLYQLTITKPIEEWLLGPERFFIPVAVILLSWVLQQVYAIFTVGPGASIQDALVECFESEEPRITWRDVYPDRDYGSTILKAWTAASEKQQRAYNCLKGRPVLNSDDLIMDCPSLAPYPFPSKSVPDWANDMEKYVEQEIELRYKRKKKSTQGMILPFKR